MSDNSKNLQTLDPKTFTNAEFITQIAMDANNAAVYRPDLGFAISHAAQITKLTGDDVNYLNHVITFALHTKHNSLKFIPLQKESVFITFFLSTKVFHQTMIVPHKLGF